jgi:exo-poly-alpha-galacturonosidase
VESAATQPTITLLSPPSAQTADSIAILWDKPAGANVSGYDVYVGDMLVATTKNTDFTLQKLNAAQAYAISVRALGGRPAPTNS